MTGSRPPSMTNASSDAVVGSPANSRSAASAAATGGRRAVHQRRHLVGERSLAEPQVRRLGVFGDDRPDLFDRPQRERQQLRLDQFVGRLHPVLAELVRAGLGRIEPAPARRWSCRACVPSAAVSSGHENACTCSPRLRRMRSTPGDDVAPLVGPADLDRAAQVVVQPEVVVGLQQHVAELGEGDAVLGVDPQLDALARQHLVDGDVFADVAQELEDRDRLCPVTVVDERPAAGVEIDDASELLLDRRRRCG